jgi:hypothetical protein
MAITKPWLGFPLCVAAAIPALVLVLPVAKKADYKWGTLTPVGDPVLPKIATCIECKSEFRVEEMVMHNGLFYCGRCKPVLLQKLIEGSEVRAYPSERSSLRTRWFWILILSVLLASWLFWTYFLTR